MKKVSLRNQANLFSFAVFGLYTCKALFQISFYINDVFNSY